MAGLTGATSGPAVGILAVQGDVREHVAAFERCGARARPVRLPEDLDGLDALALPGGESTAMSRLLAVSGLTEPLRRRVRSGLPCLATCAGLIVLSREVAGGRPDQLRLGVLDVAVRRNAYGRQVDSFEAEIDVPALGGVPFRAVFIRAPRIEEAGPAAEVLAEHGGNPVAVAQGRSIGLVFHPELTGDLRFHRLFLDRVAAAAVPAAESAA